MRVAVVGAGWAGLAAAVRLQALGCTPVVHEAAGRAGGRARAVDSARLGAVIDCGQHVLIGACRSTLALMRGLDVDPAAALHSEPLRLAIPDGSLRLGTWPLPAPLHGLGLILGGRGLGLADRLAQARLLRAIAAGSGPSAAATVSQWLQQHRCTETLYRQVWEPLCLAVMNTMPQQADAGLFRHVLARSMQGGAEASRVLIPRDTLDALWPAQACARLPALRLGHRVRSIELAAGGFRVDGQDYGGVVLATPPGEAARLLAALPGAPAWLAGWPQWAFEPIGTLSLQLAQPLRSGRAMHMLREQPDTHGHGQWLFDRSALPGGTAPELIHVVVSGASRYAGLSADTVAAGIIRQLRDQFADRLPAIVKHGLITERRATFRAVPGMRRPGSCTPWPRLTLAGDWTDTGYPAVLEGAVASGLRAAEQLGFSGQDRP